MFSTKGKIVTIVTRVTSATESVVHALASTDIDADAPTKQTARMPPMVNADRRRPTTKFTKL